MPTTFIYRALASQATHSMMALVRPRLFATSLGIAIGLGAAYSSLAAEAQSGDTDAPTESERNRGAASESASTASGETDEGAEDEPTTELAKPASKARHSPTTRTRSGRDDDVFRPSEDISEDFAVSFPVDI
jgi:hypothetical protein